MVGAGPRAMRVWLLTSELAGEVAGGIATYVDTFARLLGGARHEVTIIAQSATVGTRPLAPRVRAIGVPTPPDEPPSGGLPSGGTAAYGVLAPPAALSHAVATRALALCREEGPPDVIESQEFRGLPYFLLQRRLTEETPLARVPLVVHLHSPDFMIAAVNGESRFRLPRFWIGELEKFSIVAADALISPSRFLAAQVAQALGRRLEIDCVPYPVAVDGAALEDTPAPARGELLYVGRLEVRKGVLPFIEACARLWSAGERFRLTLAGGDETLPSHRTTVAVFLRSRYREWIDQGRLVLLGRLDRASVRAHMERAWAVVVPSLWDNFPNVCIEAMSLGCVVVASTSGGQAEMIEASAAHPCGLLFDWDVAGDVERVVHAVIELDHDTHRRIGAAARARIADICAPERVLGERVALFERAIGAVRAPRLFPTIRRQSEASDTMDGRERSSPPATLSAVVLAGDDDVGLGPTVDDLKGGPMPATDVVVVREPARDLAARQRTGIRATSGEFVVVTGAGVRIDPTFCARALAVLRRYPNVALVQAWEATPGTLRALRPRWSVERPVLAGLATAPACFVGRRSILEEWLRGADDTPQAGLDADLALLAGSGVGVALPDALVVAKPMPRRVGPDAVLELYDGDGEDDARRLLIGLLDSNGPFELWQNPGAPEDRLRYDEALAGRVLHRLRSTALGRWLLRHDGFRRLARRLLVGPGRPA